MAVLDERRTCVCPIEACVICRAPVHTCELGECPEGERHMAGGELSSGGWVCSETCWETATAWPPKRDRLTTLRRVLAGLALSLAATSFMVPAAGPQLGVALSGLLAALLCALFALLEKLPAESSGTVASRGRR